MPTFQYTARQRSGKRVSGVLDAENSGALALRLRHSDMLLVDAVPKRDDSKSVARRSGKVPGKQLTRLYSQLADLLRNGVPMLRSLQVLEKQYDGCALGPVMKDVREHVADGQGLAESLAQHPRVFPELVVSMIRAGQEGGFLEEVLKRIAKFTERQEELRGKIIGALAYPVFLLMIGFVVVSGLMIFFVPKFEPMFSRLDESGELPAITTFVLATSHLMTHFGVVVVMAGAGVFYGLKRLISTPSGRMAFDRLRLQIPLWGGIQRSLAVVRFSRILGTLLCNGIPILKALRVAKDSTGNVVLSQAIEKAAANVSSGDALTDPLRACGLFPSDVIEMVAVAEESNTLDTVLVEIADSIETITTRQMDIAVRLLEPLLLLVMAVVTLVVAAGLLLPIFRMSSAL